MQLEAGAMQSMGARGEPAAALAAQQRATSTGTASQTTINSTSTSITSNQSSCERYQSSSISSSSSVLTNSSAPASPSSSSLTSMPTNSPTSAAASTVASSAAAIASNANREQSSTRSNSVGNNCTSSNFSAQRQSMDSQMRTSTSAACQVLPIELGQQELEHSLSSGQLAGPDQTTMTATMTTEPDETETEAEADEVRLLERSNNCNGQVEGVGVSAAVTALSSASTSSLADVASSSLFIEPALSCLEQQQQQRQANPIFAKESQAQETLLTAEAIGVSGSPLEYSVSQENLAAPQQQQLRLEETAQFLNPIVVDCSSLQQHVSSSTVAAEQIVMRDLDPFTPDSHCFQAPPSPSISILSSSSPATKSAAIAPTTTTTQTLDVQKQQQQQQSTSSRFFSSKLNTGSLWSLLSVGSSSSEMANCNDNAPAEPTQSSASSSTSSSSASSKTMEQINREQSKNQMATNKEQPSTSATGFFSRVAPFKRQQPQQSQQQVALATSALESKQQYKPTNTAEHFDQYQNSEQRRLRFRFNVKYIGSAILHKNFTLPMLEWIAKDIRRQTLKGAKSIGQRQFTIPTRDIVFEIQSYQLTAISCKDGHPIFVHPMHCVSKYAQLQYDPTCFAYLIRDTKDSPSFCHVFQAKSANKVHEIFTAIREATTQIQQPMSTTRTGGGGLHLALSFDQQQASPLMASSLKSNQAPTSNTQAATHMIQRSASTDGQTSRGSEGLLSKLPGAPSSPPALLGAHFQQQQQSSPLKPSAGSIRQQQPNSSQFEDSYQFEVMFVKKVKLQCRRVPASFVDDALETLKSFEVLKGGADSKAAQIKAGIGKRIISASVDERQEYDEVCQSPTPTSNPKSVVSALSEHHQRQANATANIVGDSLASSSPDSHQDRRGSSVSLNQHKEQQEGEELRESRSCQQSPTKRHQEQTANDNNKYDQETHHQVEQTVAAIVKKHHQSMDCLIDFGLKSAKEGNAPDYANDFSPYNTITSTDLNERIAAIPVVSSSVSLDHETRQKLARQVRETLMATAASIKKGVYASGDKLDSSTSSKALDSLSCTAPSFVATSCGLDCDMVKSRPSIISGTGIFEADESKRATNDDERQQQSPGGDRVHKSTSGDWMPTSIQKTDYRRSSSSGGESAVHQHQHQHQQHLHQQSANNNFDLFRRASARQVVKNRTMLLLIGKEELCTISIDKHQMLFSKSFSSIVHCLQGNNNKDHFGLICRDSGKINPNAESYAGFIFKCQSDKVVREIMGALKQVIYSSQHNYHGCNSPYNPLNSAAKSSQSPKLERHQQQLQQEHQQQPKSIFAGLSPGGQRRQKEQASPTMPNLSLSAKRGFINPIEIEEAARHNKSAAKTIGAVGAADSAPITTSGAYASPAGLFHLISSVSTSSSSSSIITSASSAATKSQQPKNLIKSMFCNDCPLYWFHRLCCDIESLPAEASKAIILRRIDSSLTEKEQDELYSKFSEFNIESINEHNEIFMSLLRHQCERNQLRHSQSHAHLSAMAKQLHTSKVAALATATPAISPATSNGQQQRQFNVPQMLQKDSLPASAAIRQAAASGGHQRSGSTSGSLAFVIGQSNANHAGQSIADASSIAIDNFKKAKNSISVSIENILKRRSSMKDEQQDESSQGSFASSLLPARSGSFRAPSRASRRANEEQGEQDNHSSCSTDSLSSLKRSQSTTDYSNGRQQLQQQGSISSWKDSLSRTINDEMTNPLVGLFRRRSSTFGSKSIDMGDDEQSDSNNKIRNSAECLNHQSSGSSFKRQPVSPGASESAFVFANVVGGGAATAATGGSSPSSVLSSAFWKKSIFDKIRQPMATTTSGNQQPQQQPTKAANIEDREQRDQHDLAGVDAAVEKPKRTRAELRSLWKKAIAEQITLLKMEKQNQRLQANTAECDSQRIKLNYRDVSYAREVLPCWDKLLKQDPTKKVEFLEVARLVRLGIPKQRRGEIWMFLMNQYQLRHGTSFQPADSEYKGDANQTYKDLLSQLSTQQHEIFVDIGRTFPTHPYYSQYLSIGQLSLFNLLKAYSLLDQDVGYCQGLSFVAGILLLHVNSEDEAFELMRHLLFNFGLRKQYLPSMNALHLQLYQITRLLRDHEYDLFNHFDHYDISPSLYAAPWFLTLFASQFPLGFVARLLDLIFLIGIEAIFRVSLNLLAFHRNSIIARQSLEATMEFIRNDLVNIEDKNLIEIFERSMSLDLRNKLIEYEIEYTFYCAEDKARSAGGGSYSAYPPAPSIPKTNSANNSSKTLASDKNNNEQRAEGGQEDYGQDDNSSATNKQKAPESNNVDSSTSVVADATATIIIQHLLANNHLKSLRSNYTY